MNDKNKLPANISIVDETTIRDKIYEVRGVKVMLDFELAEIYGYETKNFNINARVKSTVFQTVKLSVAYPKQEKASILSMR